MIELGKLLRELRQAKGLSVRAAAHQLGLSHSRLSDFERGSTHGGKFTATPGRELLTKVAALYGYPLPTMLALAGLPETEPPIPPQPSEIEVGAQEVAQIYRDLEPRDRRMVLRLMRAYRDEAARRDQAPV